MDLSERIKHIKHRIESAETLLEGYRACGYPEFVAVLRHEIDGLKLEIFIAEQEAAVGPMTCAGLAR